jgi:5-methyltetrahydrofolate--homocysteine methyltransferase
MPSAFLDALARRVLVFDGAMGTQIHEHPLDVEADYCGCENCTDILVASRPDVIASIHRAYLDAGADAVETDTFGAMPHVLREFDIAHRAYELSRAAAELARAEADRASTADKPRFVIGSLGPGTKLATLGQITFDELVASYLEAARGLIDGGSDALLLETCQDPLQIRAALTAIRAARDLAGRTPDDLPALVNVTIETTGTMLVGTSIEAAAQILRNDPIASLGLNCATGPTEMAEHLAHLGRHWQGHTACLPNAGLPVLVDGRTEYPLQPGPFVAAMERFLDHDGLSIAGGCCGTTPEHIRQLAQLVEDRARRGVRTRRTVTLPPPGCTSLYQPTDYRQDNSFLIVGERCNASGSKAFKQLLESEDWDGIVALARQQVREGSHVLDINVDYAGRDNAADMAQVVSRLVRQVDIPLMLDSTQFATLEAGLKHAPGKCIINSANFEDGEDKFDAVCALARRHNAGLVILTIDEDKEAAMARTAERKLEIASRAIERATTLHSLSIDDLFIDPLVLPVSTGMDSDRRSALELIDGVRAIAQRFPRVQISCGLSNCSFGLKPAARVVLNSVFLHELVQAGLTAAIVHAGRILPLAKIPEDHKHAALDLIYDRRHPSLGGTGLPQGITDERHDPLAHLIDLFKDVSAAADTGPKLADLPLEDRLRRHIIDGEKQNLPAALDEALTRYAALDIINDHLLDGMKTVGELFGSGQMQLPFVLQSAEVMKMAVAHLEPHMERAAGQTKGSIVLATVKGDVHDIGKNLVDIILTNNGYTVHNLGIKQPLSDILAAWRTTNADAIGLSGLLVKSVNVMEDNLKELNDLNITVPVILGGAALTRTYAENYLRDIYKGPLLYGKDAFEGLRVMDHLVSGRLSTIQSEIDQRRAKRAAIVDSAAPEPQQSTATAVLTAPDAPDRSPDIARDNAVPTPPFWGSRVVASVPLEQVFGFINPVALFAVQWQLKRGKRTKDEYEQLLDDSARPVFERLKADMLAARDRGEPILEPRVVYGYYPVHSEGNDLVVLDPDDHTREIERFSFPRQPAGQGQGRRLCIADYFRDAAECAALGRKDVLGLSCVTVGPRATDACRELFNANRYQDYLYLHGLAVESAEGLAELWHKRMRQELGFGAEDSPRTADLFSQKYRGSRYSFGYPACPDMSDQAKLWKLIDPARIGCTLTENWQIDPEQSTSAIVVHHPQAKYFNA